MTSLTPTQYKERLEDALKLYRVTLIELLEKKVQGYTVTLEEAEVVAKNAKAEAMKALTSLTRDVVEAVIGKNGKLERSKNAYLRDTSGYIEMKKAGYTKSSVETGKARNALRKEQRTNASQIFGVEHE